MTRMVIRHIEGSKSNQVEEFPLEHVRELLLGRDAEAAVRFDPDKDDLVSRRHAKITVEPGDKLAFRIADLNSSNGVFVRGKRVDGQTILLPGDEVELGSGGPRFVFDVEPRPEYLVARTRVAAAAAAAAASKPTVVSQPGPRPAAPRVALQEPPSDLPPVAGPAPDSARASNRPSIGRSTVERLIAYQSRMSRRTLYGTAAGVLGVVLLTGGALSYQQLSVQRENAAERDRSAEEMRRNEAALTAMQVEVRRNQERSAERHGVMTAREIAAANSDATVLIRASWTLHDKASGKQLFHKHVLATAGGGTRVVPMPAYVQMPDNQDNSVVYWLTTEDEGGLNKPLVSGGGTGSGFVTTSTGFILTNKHVAANWLRPHDPPGAEGVVFSFGESVSDPRQSGCGPRPSARQRQASRPSPPRQAQSVFPLIKNWEPAQGFAFEADRACLSSGGKPNFRSGPTVIAREDIQVLFPRNRIGVQARFVRASDRADVALIKVDMPDALPTVTLAPRDYALRQGEQITVLGYPGISPERVVLTRGQELRGATLAQEIIPEPTLTEGIVGKVNSAEAEMIEADPSVRTQHTLGDYFQTTVVATGSGNSGGPVFNNEGKVIGLFTAGKFDRAGGTRISFGVPIKYAHEIIGLNPTTARAR